MRTLSLTAVLVACCGGVCLAQSKAPTFKKLQLTDKFYCRRGLLRRLQQGRQAGRRGRPVLVRGARLPEEARDPPAQGRTTPRATPTTSSPSPATSTATAGPTSSTCRGPGTDGFWYENPAGKDGHWKQHLAAEERGQRVADVGRRQRRRPARADLQHRRLPGLRHLRPGQARRALGRSTPSRPRATTTSTPTASASATSTATAASTSSRAAAGGSSRPTPKPGKPWIRHPFKFADAAAQMLVYDVDGDGLNDVITAWHCHQYGLVWYKQIRDDKGEITWQAARDPAARSPT